MKGSSGALLRRWDGAPAHARWTVLVLAGLLAYGTVVHVVQLVLSGGSPDPACPAWLSVYFVSLTVADPLAAVLLLGRRRLGVALAVTVHVTDAAANADANYGLDPGAGVTPGRVGQALVTLVAVGALVAAPGLWRLAAAPSRDGRRPLQP